MISVCIATYNGADVILEQLNSILPQLGEGDEVIISDDGSTDGTRELVAGIGDARIRTIDGPAQGSPIPNFENALRHAQGDYIFLSDQDDCWMEGKLQASLEKLRDGYDCVMTDCVVTDAELRTMYPSFYDCNRTREGRYYNLLLKNGYIGGCMAFTRRLKERCLPFPPHIPMHDLWIGNVAAFYYRVAFIHRPYSYFRRSGNNVSSSASKSPNSLATKILYRLRTILYLWRLR